MFRRLSVVCLGVACAWTGHAHAQTVYGTLSGRVLDATRAPLAEVTVTVTDVGTNTPLIAVTDVAGSYRLTRVAPSTYRVSFEKAGFRPQVRDTVAIAVNEQLAIDAVLELGAVEDVIVVEAQVPLLQARSAEVSGLIDQKRVRELPLNGGNFQRPFEGWRSRTK